MSSATSTSLLERYEPVIGLEIHVQLQTASKIFCACSTAFGAPPNRNTCPVCLGHPGVLPVMNRRVVELATRLALAAGSTVAPRSVFARKNYFYPDLAKGYQISQFAEPLALGGSIGFRREDGSASALALTRMHLEEDAGKLVHSDGGTTSAVDFNRAGVPLVEVVSEPDLRDPRDAYLFLQTLRQLVRWLEVSDGNMEEGSLRCDANISLRPRGQVELGTKAELKNLNSFRHVERAILYEIDRQARVLDAGDVVTQETRLWDADVGVSRSMRSKEEAHDYRYFPEPDLLPLEVEPSWIESVRTALPELPDARAKRYVDGFGLPDYDATVLSGSRELADYFEATMAGHADPKRVSNWIMTDLMAVMNEQDVSIDAVPVTPARLAGLLDRIDSGTLSSKLAKRVFARMVESGAGADEVIEELGIQQIDDAGEIAGHVNAVIDDNPEQLSQYLAGKDSVLQFFMGQLMRRTRGQIDPKQAGTLLRTALDARK